MPLQPHHGIEGALADRLNRAAVAVDEILGPRYHFVLLARPAAERRVLDAAGTVPVETSYVSNAPRESMMDLLRAFVQRHLQ